MWCVLDDTFSFPQTAECHMSLCICVCECTPACVNAHRRICTCGCLSVHVRKHARMHAHTILLSRLIECPQTHVATSAMCAQVNVLQRKSFFFPSFEIYGNVAGPANILTIGSNSRIRWYRGGCEVFLTSNTHAQVNVLQRKSFFFPSFKVYGTLAVCHSRTSKRERDLVQGARQHLKLTMENRLKIKIFKKTSKHQQIMHAQVNVLQRKSFFFPSFQIYGNVAVCHSRTSKRKRDLAQGKEIVPSNLEENKFTLTNNACRSTCCSARASSSPASRSMATWPASTTTAPTAARSSRTSRSSGASTLCCTRTCWRWALPAGYSILQHQLV